MIFNALKRALPVLLIFVMAGCSLLPMTEKPGTEPGAAPAASTAPEAEPAGEPAGAPRIPRVAIVLSDDIPAYSDVADELVAQLGQRTSQRFNLDGQETSVDAVMAEVQEFGPDQLVAIGLLASEAGQGAGTVPVVFCQVFNHAQSDLLTARTRGIEMIPPFELHLKPWRELAPGLSRVGVITGPGHEQLIANAARAGAAAGVELIARTVQSDQEAAYVFKRLVPEIDGFWLLPDNRILSPRALREMMGYARKHDVQVVAFSPNLFSLGALMSVASDPADVAAQVVSALDAQAGVMKPLTRASVRINADLAHDLGLTVPASTARLVGRDSGK